MEVARGTDEWRPAWALGPTRTMGIIALPARPHPTALLLDVRSLETMLETLARMRARMRPAPRAARVEATLRTLRWLMLTR